VQGPPVNNIMREPWKGHDSSKLIATFIAQPVAVYGRSSEGTTQGSGCKSSSIELSVNSHSPTGSRNRLIVSLETVPRGSFFTDRPSISCIYWGWYSLEPFSA